MLVFLGREGGDFVYLYRGRKIIDVSSYVTPLSIITDLSHKFSAAKVKIVKKEDCSSCVCFISLLVMVYHH